MTEPRAYRQLQATVPNADTPAQTAGLRMALVYELGDTTYTRDADEEDYVKKQFQEVGWSEDVKRTLTMIVERWKKQRIDGTGLGCGQHPRRQPQEKPTWQ